MPLETCECVAGKPPLERLTDIYAAFADVSGDELLPSSICVNGKPPWSRLDDIYCAARAWTDSEELPTCECVIGLTVADKLTAIYEALFIAADDDTLTDPLCIRGLPIGQQLTAIYAALLTLTTDETLPSALCVTGYPDYDKLTVIYCAALDASLFDPDAAAFFAAAGITNETQKEAVNQLVLDLKAASIWTKMVALYPFVGGAATPHSYNLANPALYQITWNGAVTHDANGVTGDGLTGYGDCLVSPNDVGVSGGVSAYCRVIGDLTGGNKRPIGASAAGAHWMLNFDPLQYYGLWGSGFASFAVHAITPIPGLFEIERVANNDLQLFKNGVSVGSSAVVIAPTGTPTPIYVLAANNSGTPVFSHSNIALASANVALTPTESAAFYSAVQAFQTTLGRAV